MNAAPSPNLLDIDWRKLDLEFYLSRFTKVRTLDADELSSLFSGDKSMRGDAITILDCLAKTACAAIWLHCHWCGKIWFQSGM